MAEQAPVGAEQEKAEQEPKSPEKEGRTTEQIKKELGDTVGNFAALSRAIEKSFTATSALLAETLGGVDLKDKKTIGQQIEAMEKGENEARSKMYGLMKELKAHPDAPKDLPNFDEMNDKQIVESFGHSVGY